MKSGGLVLCFAVSNGAFGQVNAVLSGTVSDASGALIPGVEVTAKNIKSPDMVEEVRITANNIDPAMGRGSAQVQMRTMC